MSDETIVAVFDTAEHAQAAYSALVSANVPQDAISMHAGTATGGAATNPSTAAEPFREQGFWSSLFGGEPDHDTAVYDRSIAGGSTVVSVRVPELHATRVMEILNNHNPIDLDERATGYGLTRTTTTTTTTSQPVAAATMPIMTDTASARPAATAMPASTARATSADETLQLSEERLAVGKRVVNRGGVRVRRYVVETPVEENVSLHSERVVLERHPVTDDRPVTPDAFGDRTIEMTESAEEAVVSKTARVVEEIGLRKEATDRVETVRDTVRKEEAEVVQVPATETTTRTGTVTTTGGAGGTATPPKR